MIKLLYLLILILLSTNCYGDTYKTILNAYTGKFDFVPATVSTTTISDIFKTTNTWTGQNTFTNSTTFYNQINISSGTGNNNFSINRVGETTILTNSVYMTSLSSAINFGGADQSVSIGDSTYLDFPSSFTINLWAKPALADPAADGVYLGKYDGSSNDGYFFIHESIGTGRWRCSSRQNSNEISVNSNGSPTGGWQMITYMRNDNSKTTLYIDSVLQTSTNTVTGDINSSGKLYLGTNWNGTANDWSGRLDEITIFKGYNPTQAELTALYNNGIGLYYGRVNNPSVVIHFDGDVLDFSGNSLNGTLNNSPTYVASTVCVSAGYYNSQILKSENNTNNNRLGKTTLTSQNNGIYGDLVLESNQIDFNILGVSKLTVNNSGNVGIGTTNPVATLSVTGTVNVSSNSSVGGILNVTGASNLLGTITAGNIIQANSASGLSFRDDGGTARLNILDNGHVLMGSMTDSPADILIISQTTSNQWASMAMLNNSKNRVIFGIGGTDTAFANNTGYFLFDDKNPDGGDGVGKGIQFAGANIPTRYDLFISTNGNVGISRNNPSHSLDVKYGLNVSSNLIVGNNSSFGASTSYKVDTTTYSITLTTSYNTVIASNTVTITLPTAVGNSGLDYYIVYRGTSTCTIDGNLSELVNESETQTIYPYESLHIKSDNVGWWAQ